MVDKDDDIFALAQAEAQHDGEPRQKMPEMPRNPPASLNQKMLDEMRKQTELQSSIRTILVWTLIIVPVCLIVLGIVFGFHN